LRTQTPHAFWTDEERLHAVMGGQQSRGDNADGAREQKEKKTKKYEAPAPTRVGRKKKKARLAPAP
jgi:hypothetical protein